MSTNVLTKAFEILTRILKFCNKSEILQYIMVLCMIYVVTMSTFSSVSISGSGIVRVFMILTCGQPCNLFNKVLL